jgi:dihydropteroate synthase
MHMQWQTTRFALALDRPLVMGIVNVTPDSFSDGGRFMSTRMALEHCEQLMREGADILDIGGESTRPGIPPVPLDEERARVLPVLREAVKFGFPLSVDTYKPELMREALDLGADIINDIWALRQPGAVDVVAGHANCGVCLMHMHGEPQTMQRTPMQGDPVLQVRDFLRGRSEALRQRGVSVSRIAWDPGIGFGKKLDQNFALLARQRELLHDGYPLLAGWSRKSSLGTVTGAAVNERVPASVAAALLAVDRGAAIVRVHDVRETVAALKVWSATQAALTGQGAVRT